jgi:hypothetical protein
MEMAFLLETKPGEESSAPGAPPLPHYVAPLNEKFAPRPPDVPDDYILFGLRRGSVVEEIRWMPPGAPPPRVSDFPDALMPAINQILLRIYNENPHAIVNGMTSSAFRQFQAQQARLEAGELSPLEAQSFLDTRGRMIDYFTNPPAESAPQAATGGAGSGATIGPLIAAPAPEPTPAPARSTNNFPVEYVPPPPIEFTDPSRKLVDFSLGAGHGDHAPPEETQFNQWPRPRGSTELPLTQRPYTPEPEVEEREPDPVSPEDLGWRPQGEYQDWTGLGTATETQSPEMGRGNFDPEEARRAARRLIDELRERSRRTGENFDTLLGDALDRLNREDPLFAIMLRAQLSYLQINAPARGGAPSEPHDAFDSPLEQLDAKLAELGRAGNPIHVRERVQALVEDIKMGNYPMSHPRRGRRPWTSSPAPPAKASRSTA